MKLSKASIYAIVILGLCNISILFIDYNQILIKSAIFLPVMIFFSFFCKRGLIIIGAKNRTVLSILIFILSIISLGIICYEFIIRENFLNPVLLTFIILCCESHISIKIECFSKIVLIICSGLNLLTLLVLSGYYFIGNYSAFSVLNISGNDSLITWIVFVLCSNIITACVFRKYLIWFAINTFVASFVLYCNKNIFGLCIIALCFVFITLFDHKKETIKIELVFAVITSFSFCMMAPIIHYLTPLTNGVDYSVNLSRYIEIVLAVALGLILCYWDKIWEFIDGKKSLKIKHCIIIFSVIIITFVITIVLFYDRIKNFSFRVVNYALNAFNIENNFIFNLYSSQGIIGAILAILWIVAVIMTLYNFIKANSQLRDIQRFTVIFILIYLSQILLLPQSIEVTVCYAIFILALDQNNKIGGKNINE